MLRSRGLVLGGAFFATFAGLTIAVSSAAAPSVPAVGITHTAQNAGGASVTRVRAVTAAVSGTAVAVAASRPADAFVRTSGSSVRRKGHRSSNVPLVLSQIVTGVSPNVGAAGAGGEQMVKINGSGFTGATDVYFSPSTDVNSTAYPCLLPSPSAAGCFTVVSDTEIDADTPVEGSGTVDVTVGSGSVNPGDQYIVLSSTHRCECGEPSATRRYGHCYHGGRTYPTRRPLR